MEKFITHVIPQTPEVRDKTKRVFFLCSTFFIFAIICGGFTLLLLVAGTAPVLGGDGSAKEEEWLLYFVFSPLSDEIVPLVFADDLVTIQFLSQLGDQGDGDGQFTYPTGIALDSQNDKVYVTDSGNNRVQIFNSAGTYIGQFGSDGDGDGQFTYPTEIALDLQNDKVYVTDFDNNRVQIFNSAGTYIGQFGSDGDGDGQFTYPTGIALDSQNDKVYVTDSGNNRVQIFNSAGTYIGQFGSDGDGDGQFTYPTGIALDSQNDRIYVVDSHNNRVQVFNSATYTYVFQFGYHDHDNHSDDGQFNSPTGITLDSQNDRIYVTDSINDRVQIFNSAGTYIGQFGSDGDGDGQFTYPTGIALDSQNDKVYVTDSGNHRVQLFAVGSGSNNAIPVITLLGNNPVSVELNVDTYTDAGATAYDAEDGYITENIVIVNPVDESALDTYTVTYDVADSQNAAAKQVTRTVKVQDTTPPAITLNGTNPQIIELGSAYAELGAIVSDNDSDYSGTVSIDASAVRTNKVGTYAVTYDAQADASGNAASQAIRKVSVIPSDEPTSAYLAKIDQSKILRDDNSRGIYGLQFGSDGALYVMPGCTTTLYRMNPTDHTDVSEFEFPDVFGCSDDFAFNSSHDIHMLDRDTGDLFVFKYTGDFTWNTVEYEGPISVNENCPDRSDDDDDENCTAQKVHISSDDSKLYTFWNENHVYRVVDLYSKKVTTAYTVPDPQWTPAGGITEDSYGKIYFADKPNHKVIKYDPVTNSTSVYLDMLAHTINDRRLVFPSLIEFDGRGGFWVVPAMGARADIDDPPDNAEEYSEFTVKFDYATKKIISYYSDDSGDSIGKVPSAVSAVDPRTGILFVGGSFVGSLGGLAMVTDGYSSDPLMPGSSPPRISDGGGGCDNCEPPTLGVDRRGIQMVQGGFTFNGITTDVEYYYTPYELITVNIGADNLAEFKIYDDGGPANIRHFEFAYGMDRGQHMQQSNARIEYDIDFQGNETLTIIDPQNAIENNSTRIVTSTVPCKPGATYDCLLVQVHHVFRAPLGFDIVGTNVWDKHRNSVQNYYNHGISIEGESLNPPRVITVPADTTQNHPAGTGGTVSLLQIDLTRNLWIDKWGYVWQGDESRMRLLSEIPFVRHSDNNVPSEHPFHRNHSEFPNAVLEQQIINAEIFDATYGSVIDNAAATTNSLDDNYDNDNNNDTRFSFADELAYAQQAQMQQELAELEIEYNMLSSERAARELLESSYPHMFSYNDAFVFPDSATVDGHDDYFQSLMERIHVLDALVNWQDENNNLR